MIKHRLYRSLTLFIELIWNKRCIAFSTSIKNSTIIIRLFEWNVESFRPFMSERINKVGRKVSSINQKSASSLVVNKQRYKWLSFSVTWWTYDAVDSLSYESKCLTVRSLFDMCGRWLCCVAGPVGTLGLPDCLAWYLSLSQITANEPQHLIRKGQWMVWPATAVERLFSRKGYQAQ